MQTEGIGHTGLSPASDFCHFPDCSGVELDGWQAFSEGAPKHAFQTQDLSDIWSANGSDDILTPGLSSLEQLSSFEGYPLLSDDTPMTGDDTTTTLQDAFKINATPWMGDTFSYFYGSQYNPFGCAFSDNGRETAIDSHTEESAAVAPSPVKPSYSEIAKSSLGGNLSKKTSEDCVYEEPIRNSKSSTQPKSRTIRHVPFDPVPINPGSAYGLDTFATPRHVLQDRQRSQHGDSFVTSQTSDDTCVQDSVDPARPAHNDRCTNVPLRYGLDSFDVPLHDAKRRQSSSTERDLPRLDGANMSFKKDHFDVNDFCDMHSFGTYDLFFGDRDQNTCMSNNEPSSMTAEKSAAGSCRETADDENCGTSQNHTATLNDITTVDSKITAHDRKRSRSRTKPTASTSTESQDSSKQSAHSSKQSANCPKQSASKTRLSASNGKQPADSKSTCILNNSKPVSSNGCAFRPRSVDQINNNVRDDSKAKGKTQGNNVRENSKVRDKMCNNNVRDDNKMKEKTRKNLQEDSKVKDKTRNNVRDGSKVTNTTHSKTDVSGDNKVTDETCSSGNAKTSKRTTVVETKVDYLELMEQLHDFTARAGQYVFEVLYKCILTVLWLLLIIIKDLSLLAVSLVIYGILACQRLVKKLMDKYYQGQQHRSYTPPPQWSSGDSTDWPPPSGGNIELPTTGDEAVRRLLSCDEKNPYSVLGVGVDASDEDIKRFYRRQAILVHPDKNGQAGSEEAFKKLQNAFDIICDPEKREELRRTQEDGHKFSQEADAAMRDIFDQISRLRKEMKEAADRLVCDQCGGSHLRVATDRCVYAARYCGTCYEYHAAREDDVWAETRYAFRYSYFACMDGIVYNITEWATCQGRLSGLSPNLHKVQVHLKRRHQTRTRDEDLDEFLRQFDQSTSSQTPSYNTHNTHTHSSHSSHSFTDNTWKPKSRKQRRKRRK